VVKVGREVVVVALDKEEVDVPRGRLWLWVDRLSCSALGLQRLIVRVYVESSLPMMLRTRGIRAVFRSLIVPI